MGNLWLLTLTIGKIFKDFNHLLSSSTKRFGSSKMRAKFTISDFTPFCVQRFVKVAVILSNVNRTAIEVGVLAVS